MQTVKAWVVFHTDLCRARAHLVRDLSPSTFLKWVLVGGLVNWTRDDTWGDCGERKGQRRNRAKELHLVNGSEDVRSIARTGGDRELREAIIQLTVQKEHEDE